MRSPALIALASLALFWACAEPPTASSPDAALDAIVSADAARPAGAPCALDADCEGVCRRDPRTGGARCFIPCAPDCPAGTRCETVDATAVCVVARVEAMAGEPCGLDTPCVEGTRCSADLAPDQLVCAPICTADGDCPAGTRCGPEGVCAAGDAPAFSCPFVDCVRGDLICVDGRCAASCADVDRRCVDGGHCGAGPEGALLCLADGAGTLGSACVSGGDASCASGLTCWQRAPGDPAAICSRPCADDCPADSVCRRPEGFAERVCLLAPFGPGTGEAGPFEPCADHGPTDCRPELDCVIGPAGAPICAAPCAAGCGDDAVCDDAGLTPHCRRRTRERIGLACLSDDDCPAGRCVPASVPYCTAGCAPSCPPGFYCAGDECLIGEADARPLGAACGADGAATCASGICAVGPRDPTAVCTRPCPDDDCPAGFECAALDASRLCFPEP